MNITGRIIDFHTHAFPDTLAERAMSTLQAEAPDVSAWHDGRLSSLIAMMDECGIERSVVCSIATKPAQFDPILAWSREIASDRIIPLPSVHPDDDNIPERLATIRDSGFLGIKLHPYYQEFKADDERMFALYEEVIKQNLMIVMHTGFDIAFERRRICDPIRIASVYERYPEIKLVATHLGAWEDWDEVEAHIIGKPIYMELSFALDYLKPEQARRMIVNHQPGYIMFGTDSPWTGQRKTLELLRALELGDDLEQAILRDNALRLLELAS